MTNESKKQFVERMAVSMASEADYDEDTADMLFEYAAPLGMTQATYNAIHSATLRIIRARKEEQQ